MEHATNVQELKKHPNVPLIARVQCKLPSGRVVTLYATEVYLGGVTCLALNPPPVGTSLVLTLRLLTMPPLPPLEARVIGVRIDPESAERCSFEAIFINTAEEVLERMAMMLDKVAPYRELQVLRRAVSVPERRAHPRVATRLPALVSSPMGTAEATVLNLSMEGGLLSLVSGASGSQIAAGDSIEILLPRARHHSEFARSKANVVRCRDDGTRVYAGVRFVDRDEETKAAIEELIMSVLVPDD